MKMTQLAGLLLLVSSTTHAMILSADTKEIKIDNKQCITAADNLMLQVTPEGTSEKRYYSVKQIPGQYEYIYEDTEHQIVRHQLIGKDLCNGVLSYSDMSLPFTKTMSSQIIDVNDGLLLLKVEKQGLDNLNEVLKSASSLIEHAEKSKDPSELSYYERQFERLKSETSRIIWNSSFNEIDLFLTGKTFKIPTHHETNFINLSLFNKFPNIYDASLDTIEHMNAAREQVYEYRQFIAKIQSERQHTMEQFKQIAQEDAVITKIDLRKDKFVITKESL